MPFKRLKKRSSEKDVSKAIEEASSNDPLDEVEEILDKKLVNDRVRYLIKWRGCPRSQSTWEPIKNLTHIQGLIDKFERAWGRNKGWEEESDYEERGERSYRKKAKNKNKSNKKLNSNEKIKSNKRSSNKSITQKKKKGFDDDEDSSYYEEEEEDEEDEESDEEEHSKYTPSKRKAFKKELNYSTPTKGSKKKSEKCTQSHRTSKKVKTNDHELRLQDIAVNLPLQGHFKFGDKPKRILAAKIEGPYVICTIEWQVGPDGVIPLQTNMSNTEIRQYDPHLLLDFYESRITWISGLKNKNKGNDSHQSATKPQTVQKNPQDYFSAKNMQVPTIQTQEASRKSYFSGDSEQDKGNYPEEVEHERDGREHAVNDHLGIREENEKDEGNNGNDGIQEGSNGIGDNKYYNDICEEPFNERSPSHQKLVQEEKKSLERENQLEDIGRGLGKERLPMDLELLQDENKLFEGENQQRDNITSEIAKEKSSMDEKLPQEEIKLFEGENHQKDNITTEIAKEKSAIDEELTQDENKLYEDENQQKDNIVGEERSSKDQELTQDESKLFTRENQQCVMHGSE